jgi:flagellin
MQKALEFNEVYQENILAARSLIADTDYAHEISNLVSSKIMLQAGTSILAHSNFTASMTLGLLQQLG